jgi:hypothetical protein
MAFKRKKTITTDYDTDSRAEMIEHLRRHREAGDRVPDRAFEILEEDTKKHGDNANVPWIE